MNLKFVYKIINNDELQKAKFSGTYLGSSKDNEDGYIHFSGQYQIEGTLQKYYKREQILTLLKIETLNLDHLVWEQASDGNFFPHLYSSLDLANVVDEYEIILQDGGSHKLPENY